MMKTCPPPAHLRDNTHDRDAIYHAKMLCVDTPAPKHWPERDAFFDWFDARKRAVKIRSDALVARRAGLDGSSISSWRTGRQRPSTTSLSAVAAVLEVGAQEAWDKAGLLTAGDAPRGMTPEIRQDLITLDRAIKDPDTDPEDLVVIEATLEMLLARLSGRAKRNAA
jgi:transcriptional regulator with XRE-family HTH domain